MHQSTTLRISIDLPMPALLARLVTADPAIEVIEREIALRGAARLIGFIERRTRCTESVLVRKTKSIDDHHLDLLWSIIVVELILQ
jgi:hypothetical protein